MPEGAAGPVPPGRAAVLSRLQYERWHAANNHDGSRVAELDRQIRQLSAGSAENPAKETTGGPQVAAPRRKR